MVSRNRGNSTEHFVDASEQFRDHRQAFRRSKLSPACTTCRYYKTRCLPVKGRDTCQFCVKKLTLCTFPDSKTPPRRSSRTPSALEKTFTSPDTAGAKGNDLNRSVKRSIPNTANGSASARPVQFDNFHYLVGRPRRCKLEAQLKRKQSKLSADVQPDVVDRGIVDIPSAEVLFNHWNFSMRPVLPILNLPPPTTVTQLREKTPILFLAITAVASGSILPWLEAQLIWELNNQLALQIFILGNRSMELVQACLLYSQYYTTTPGSESLSVVQYVSAAVAMMGDLGLNQSNISMIRSILSRDTVKEAARTWLACWYTASSHSALHQRQYPMPPTSEFRSVLDILTTEGDLSTAEKWFCCLVRLQSIMEDASNTVNRVSAVAFDEPRTQCQLRLAQQRVEDWSMSLPEGADLRVCRFVARCADLCVHRIAVRSFTQESAFRYEGELTSPRMYDEIPPTASQMFVLRKCLESTQEILNIYLGWEPSFARSLPNSFLMWTLYAAESMIKLKSFEECILSSESAGSRPQATDCDSVNSYLDAMTRKLGQNSQNKYHPQSKSAALAFIELRSSYSKTRQRRMCTQETLAVELPYSNRSLCNVFQPDAECFSPGVDWAAKPRQRDTQLSHTEFEYLSWQLSLEGHPDSGSIFCESYKATSTSSASEIGNLHGSSLPPPTDSILDLMRLENRTLDNFATGAQDLEEFDALVVDHDTPWNSFGF